MFHSTSAGEDVIAITDLEAATIGYVSYIPVFVRELQEVESKVTDVGSLVAVPRGNLIPVADIMDGQCLKEHSYPERMRGATVEEETMLRSYAVPGRASN